VRKNLLFGPVKSRRLGYSLGIEMVPHKVCSFDCIYCEVGRTTNLTCKREHYYPEELILKSIKEASKLQSSFDFFTFTGSGEPTLSLAFEAGVELAKKLVKKPIALLTNSSLLCDEGVLNASAKLDVILPSLDAVFEDVFRKVNQPADCVSLQKIISSLFELRRKAKGEVWVEVLLVKGINDAEEHLKELKRILKDLSPHKIQLNTVVRPGARKDAKPLNFSELEKLAKFFGERAEVVVSKEALEKKGKGAHLDRDSLKEKILEYTLRRPAPLKELSEALGVEEKLLYFVVDELLKEGKLKKTFHHDKEYFLSSNE